MKVKTDRKDARGIAQLLRMGWFRRRCTANRWGAELRAVLTARKLAQSKLLDVELSLRGILRGFGLKVGLTTRRSFPAPFASWSANHPTLQMIAEALLSACEELNRQLLRFEASVRNLARNTL